MPTRTNKPLALPALALLLSACPDEDAAYAEYLEHADATATTDGEPPADDGSASLPASSTGDDADETTSSGEPSTDLPPDDADAPPEIVEFTVSPVAIDEAGPVSIAVAFSPSVASALLFEKFADETRVLEILDPADAFVHEYAVTSESFNGEHEIHVQAFDDRGRAAQAVSSFDAALPPGGTPVWHHVDYDPDDDALFAYGADVAVHGDGVVVVGVRYVDLAFHLVARRYDANDDLDWEYETAEPVAGEAVAVDHDGNVIVVGELAGAKPRMWLHKLDANGQPIWAAPRTGVPDTSGYDVVTDASGQIYVAGKRHVALPDDQGGFSEDDAMIWEFTSSGAMAGWATYDNNSAFDWGDDLAYGITVRTDGRVVLAGSTTSAGGNNFKVGRALVLEYAAHQLEPVWSDSGGQWDESAALGIVADAQGGVVFAGWTREDEFEPTRLAVRRLSPSYGTDWSYPGYPATNRPGIVHSVARMPDGRTAVGASIAGQSSENARVFTTTEAGGPSWFPAFEHDGSDGSDDYIYGVAVDPFGYVYYVGSETVDGTSRLMIGRLHP